MAAGAVGTNAFGLDAELFTRGTGDDQPRGETLVQRHLNQLQAEKEALAMQKLGALMPGFGAPVRALALKEAVQDVDTALSLLRAFQTAHVKELHGLHKKQRKLLEAEAEAVKEAEEAAAAEAARAAKANAGSDDSGSSSESDSSSGSSSGSDSDSDDGGRRSRKKRRSKDSKRRSSRSKSGKKRSSKDSKRRSSGKDKKRSSRDRKKEKDKPLTAAEQYGRFGIIRETDAYAKRSEFTLWAMEVKKQDVELLGRVEERELFKDYMEDFNTGTLPHRKFYNLEIYEREKAAKRAAKGIKDAPKTAKQSALEDERALRKAREEERAKLAEERLQQALVELQGTSKAQDMKEQEMLRMQMQAAYKTGDKRKAELIYKQLMTDDEKIAKGIMKPKKKP